MNLGPDNCLLVLLLALTEQKILLHSLRPAVLTSVAEAVMQIIFPFYWQCPYIPLCPIGMSDYLAAPLPFVIGLDSRFFDLYDQPVDVNAVDLDTNTITVCEERRGRSSLNAAKHLPKRPARLLKARLVRLTERCAQHASYAHKLAAQMDDGAIDFDFTVKRKEQQLELEIREAFLHFMVGILSGYRHFLLPITSAPTVGATDAGNLFDQVGFLRSRDRNYHKFYSMLMRTQMFTKFIEERSFVSDTNTCLAFFDECVDRAIAHHQQQLQGERGEEPRFLLELDGLYESDRTVFILPPEPADLPDGAEFRTDTFSLDPLLFPEHTQGSTDEGVGGRDGGENGGVLSTEGDGGDDVIGKAVLQTPASALARRTKQEIRSAQKIAKKNQTSPYQWARCLINTAYSLWFIHLPGYVMFGSSLPSPRPPHQSLRIGLTLLQRMKRLRLHPADEICYRVLMQLCGVYDQPTLAVKVLFEMRNIGLHPNAVTYGYYNKAVLESEWPSGETSATRGQVLWTRIRNVLLAMAIFRRVGREKNFKDSRFISASTNAVDAASSTSSAAAVAAALAGAGGGGGGGSSAGGSGTGKKEELDGVSHGSSELSQESATSSNVVVPTPLPPPQPTATAAAEPAGSTTTAVAAPAPPEARPAPPSSGAKDDQAVKHDHQAKSKDKDLPSGVQKPLVTSKEFEKTEEGDNEGLQMRERLRSIVKPQGHEEEDVVEIDAPTDPSEGTPKIAVDADNSDVNVAENTRRRLSFGEEVEEEEEEQDATPDSGANTRYTRFRCPVGTSK